jgi:hypothetical protein
MKTKKLIYFLGFFFALLFLIAPKGWTQPKPETEAPIITHAFAVDKGGYGYIWKIYIEAKAGDANMSRIAMVVDEPGVGRYPTDWLNIKPQNQKDLKGYIQWNTHSVSGHLQEWTEITLKVSIVDKAGNESNVAVFPFTFESGVKDQYKYKLPAPFDQGDIPKLGYIDIDLLPPGGGDFRG